MKLIKRDEGFCLYFGQKAGSRYVGIYPRGFSGWRTSTRLRGGWYFFNPTISTGCLYELSSSKSWSCEVLVPARRKRVRQWKQVRS